MKRIKVLHIITHLGVGGALDNTLLTVERLPRDSYEVHLAAGPFEPGYTNWEERSRGCADELRLFPTLQRRVSPLRDLQACRQLTRHIRHEGYDIVHTHCAKAGVVGRFAAYRAGAPVLVHTCHAFAAQVTRVPSRTFTKRFSSRTKESIFNLAERLACKISDKVITVCEQNRRQAIQQRLAAPEKITAIYSGVDLDRFERVDRTSATTTLDLDPDRPVVGFIGRLTAQKAPLDFVTAAKQVLIERPDAQFVIAGDGPMVETVLAAICGEHRIKYIGFCDDVPRLLSALDVLAVSSLWEGLGRSVTEAMIIGVPVAATAVDGVPELISHRETGLLSPPNEPTFLAKNILRLLGDPQESSAIADRARQRVAHDFGADEMVVQIDELYQGLLRKKGVLP